MLKDEEIAAAQREGIRRVYWEVFWCFGGITARPTILVVLLFRAFRHARPTPERPPSPFSLFSPPSRTPGPTLELPRLAEAAASATRAQLKAVIDAVPA